MEKWQQSDLLAFEELYQQHKRLVFKNALLITGSKDDAEDVIQDVFIAVWRYRETFDSTKAKFTTWLHRITVNESTRKRKKNNDFTFFDELDFPDVSGRQPEEILVTKTEYESLLKMLNELDKKHRSVVVLKYFNDLSYSDIAEILNIPLGTVKSRLNHALTCLKERLVLEKEAMPEEEGKHGL
ncbi:RNA polymerase sigma factor [Chloroflexota bacterium]